jgi:hypothetical protein
MVEKRHLEHWVRQRSAREQARSAVPAAWLTDPRPEMLEVVDAYVEAMVRHAGEKRRTTRSGRTGLTLVEPTA